MTIQKRLRDCTIALALALIVTFSPAYARKAQPVDPVEKEIQIGKEAVKDLEKKCKLVEDEAILSRVRTIGARIAEIARSEEVSASYGDSKAAPFDYTFKVIEDKSVNAFSLPGGFVYVHTGLLDFIQSDHELAAVLAHEVAHAAHHHMRSLLRAQSKLQSRLALILLLGLVGNIPQRDLSHMMLGTQFYQIARLNGYGQEAEKDADLTAIHYLLKTEYNPVGMLTFLERLNRRPELVQLGIFQTHPNTGDRISDVLAVLRERKIEIDRRSVTNAAKAEVREVETESRTVSEILLGDKPLVKLSGDRARAERVANSINYLLDNAVAMRDIRTPDDRGLVLVKGRVLLAVNSEDAGLNGGSTTETARRVSDGIKRIVWQEMMDMLR